jgi:hypothetical protein
MKMEKKENLGIFYILRMATSILLCAYLERRKERTKERKRQKNIEVTKVTKNELK